MKKIISVLLSVAVIASLAAFCAQGESYPESAHDYANNTDQTWTYTHPGAPAAIFVTFSDETFVEPGTLCRSLPETFTPEDLEHFVRSGTCGREGDRIELLDRSDTLVGTYTADELAGQTIPVSGDRVTIRLISDGSVSGYGFAIEQVTDVLPRGCAQVNYHLKDDCFGEVFETGRKITLNTAYAMRQIGSEMVVGWKTADGKAYTYENTKNDLTGKTKTDLIAADRAVYDLYPILCPISLTSDEVYSFQNYRDIFNAEMEGYIYMPEHYRQFFIDEIATFGLSPFAPLAAVGLGYLALYWPNVSFVGSCTGFALTELLQHYGKIDLLSRQGVSTVRELEPDDALLSAINFYAVQAIPGHVTYHMGIDPGTKAYSEQLRKLYDTVASGKPVYFEFYLDEQHPMKTIFKPGSGEIGIGHSIVLTGAYTDTNGNHILIAADCNSVNYVSGTCTTLYIDPDFTELHYPYWMDADKPLDGFSWTEELSQFDALPLEGTPNPAAWYKVFFRNLGSLLGQLFGMYLPR